MKIVQAALAITYPFLIWLGLLRFEPREVAVGVLAFAGLRMAFQKRDQAARAVRMLWLPALVICGVVGAVALWNDPLGLLLMPVAISLAFLTTFLHSLRSGQPMIERFARLQVGTLSLDEVSHCRRVTWVWCVFFVVNAGIAGLLAWIRALETWAFYTGLVSYLMMGTLFAAEYLYRHWRFRRYVGSLTDPLLKRIFPPRDNAEAESDHGRGIRPKVLTRDSSDRVLRVEWSVPPDLACWPGHFKDDLLLPGVLQIEWIVREIELWRGVTLDIREISRLKFKKPLRPQHHLHLEVEANDDGSEFRAGISLEGDNATSLRLKTAKRNTSTGFLGEADSLDVLANQAMPSPSSVLPHQGTMLWLSKVIEQDETSTVCEARVEDLGFFRDPTGGSGAWIALEWMAQSVAAHDGVRRYVAGQGIRPGMLLGSKTIRFAEGAAAPAGVFRIRASPVFGGDSGMVAYECVVDEVSTGRRWAEARLACRVGGAGEAISDSQD